MAIHDSVLLGAMSQSVDNLTMCVCRKLRIVRHKAKHVTNPRTDKQRVQRAKMKATIELAQAFAPIAKIGSSDLKLRTPKVTATLADKSITFTQESQEASSWANRDDQVYAVVYEKALNEVEMVKLRERGENGVTSFALPEDWTAAEVLVYAFATTIAGRRTSRTLAISME